MDIVEIPGEIEHLDFDPEKEEKKRHIRHPTDRSANWCGEKATTDGYKGTIPMKDVRDINCVECLHHYIKFGANWWWQTHRTFYNSRCYKGDHYCD